MHTPRTDIEYRHHVGQLAAIAPQRLGFIIFLAFYGAIDLIEHSAQQLFGGRIRPWWVSAILALLLVIVVVRKLKAPGRLSCSGFRGHHI